MTRKPRARVRASSSGEVKNYFLANGKPLNKENVDIKILTNLNNVQRAFSFAGVPPSVNMSVTEHSYLTMLVACRFMKEFDDLLGLRAHITYPYTFYHVYTFAMLHDIAEACLGDVPTPLKHPDFEHFEDEVRTNIFDYLGVELHIYKFFYGIVKFCDVVASLYECHHATSKGYDLSKIYEYRYDNLLKIYELPAQCNQECKNCNYTSTGEHSIEYNADGSETFVFKLSRDIIDNFILDIIKT